MDRREFTEDEASAFLVTGLINARDGNPGVLMTGVRDVNALQNMNYTVLDVLAMAVQQTTEANRQALERRPEARLPTRTDYQLAGEVCPLEQTFRTAWRQYERSR